MILILNFSGNTTSNYCNANIVQINLDLFVLLIDNDPTFPFGNINFEFFLWEFNMPAFQCWLLGFFPIDLRSCSGFSKLHCSDLLTVHSWRQVESIGECDCTWKSTKALGNRWWLKDGWRMKGFLQQNVKSPTPGHRY